MDEHDPRCRAAPGRVPVTISPRWVVVLLTPVLGVLVLGLVRDEKLVEVIDDPQDVDSYLRSSRDLRRASRLVSRAEDKRKAAAPEMTGGLSVTAARATGRIRDRAGRQARTSRSRRTEP
jgi:hypothetical protein